MTRLLLVCWRRSKDLLWEDIPWQCRYYLYFGTFHGYLLGRSAFWLKESLLFEVSFTSLFLTSESSSLQIVSLLFSTRPKPRSQRTLFPGSLHFDSFMDCDLLYDALDCFQLLIEYFCWILEFLQIVWRRRKCEEEGALPLRRVVWFALLWVNLFLCSMVV